MNNNKETCLSLLQSVKRSRIDLLITHLENRTDYFTAPASTNYHGAEEGGLLAHSLAVYHALVKLVDTFALDIPHDSVVICALLHDICKTNFYKKGTRNVQNPETKKWEQVDTWVIDDKLPLGHGEKSVIMLQNFIRLTLPEMVAIRWHMAGYDDAARAFAGGMMLNQCYREHPLAVALHLADMTASYLEKK